MNYASVKSETLTFRLPLALRKRLEVRAKREHRSLSSLILVILDQELNEEFRQD